MKKLLLAIALLALPATALAAPVSWDYTTNLLQPLQSGWNALVKAARFQATSTTASIFPYASTTVTSAAKFCLTGDLPCISAWPTGGGGNAFAYLFPSNATTTSIAFNGGLTGVLTGSLVGNADTATALAANGANCSSGNAPLGVNASGAVESCFDVWTQAENTSAAYLSSIVVDSPLSGAGTSASHLTISTSGTWSGNAGTATALAANGTNCTSQAATGVDASGNAEGCFTVSTFLYPFPSNATSTSIAFNGGLTGVLTGSLVGNASTATALAANGTNASAGNAILGVDASGNAEGAFDVWTEAENTAAAYAAQATTITVNGTANQITSSAGAQSLAANRTWTLSIPSQFNIQNASTTNLSANTLAVGGTGTTSIALDGTLKIQTLTGLLKAASGVVSTASNGTDYTLVSAQSCTNQVITALTASGASTCSSIANAMITNGTIDLTTKVTGVLPIANGGTNASSFGTSNGITAYDGTRLVNFAGYTLTSLLLTITNASTTALTASSFFQIPNSTSQSPLLAGACGWDTTSGQFKCGDGTATQVIGNGKFYPSFTYATSTAWTGTTTIPLGPAYIGETWNGVQCFTDTGTLGVSFYDGTNRMSYIPTASTTVNINALTTNNTFTASEKRYVDIGTPASSPTRISCTVSKSYTAD
jgi:hypothetical protein